MNKYIVDMDQTTTCEFSFPSMHRERYCTKVNAKCIGDLTNQPKYCPLIQVRIHDVMYRDDPRILWEEV